MKEYQSTDVRNVAFWAQRVRQVHVGRVLLLQSGCLDRMGRTEDGNLASDYDPEEIKRHIRSTRRFCRSN